MSELESLGAPRLRGLARGGGRPSSVIAPIDAGLARRDPARRRGARVRRGRRADRAAIVRLVPERARGVGLGAPPHVLALRALAPRVRPAGRVAGSAS